MGTFQDLQRAITAVRQLANEIQPMVGTLQSLLGQTTPTQPGHPVAGAPQRAQPAPAQPVSKLAAAQAQLERAEQALERANRSGKPARISSALHVYNEARLAHLYELTLAQTKNPAAAAQQLNIARQELQQESTQHIVALNRMAHETSMMLARGGG